MKITVQKDKPSLISNLYEDSNSIFDNLKGFNDEFGEIEVKINKNYYQSFRREKTIYKCTISDYIQECKLNPSFNLQCTETSLSNKMKQFFILSKKFDIPDANSRYFFMAYRGAIAPIHFDWDFCDVLLTQIIGRKRVVLFKPEVGKRLFPLSNTSLISFHSLSTKEQNKIIDLNGGFEFILNPNDTVYIPKLWWHYVEYLDFGVSINYRYGNSEYERRLINLPRNYYLQSIGHYLNKYSKEKEKERLTNRILETYYKEYANGLERYIVMRKLYKDLYKELYKSLEKGIIGDYVGDNFDLELTINKEKTNKNYTIPFHLFDAVSQIKSHLTELELSLLLNYLGFENFGINKLNPESLYCILHTAINSKKSKN